MTDLPSRTKQRAIADSITGRIAAGRLREGDRLPSEEQLARDYEVSLGTVQKALADLARVGVITREHGRGTFVSGTQLAPADVRFLQFRDARGRSLPLFVRVIKATRLKGAGVWSRFLGQRACVRIDRLFEAGPRVRLASEFYLRAEDYAALGAAGFQVRPKAGSKPDQKTAQAMRADNLRELLARRLSLPTLRVEQLIRVAAPTARSARMLGLKTVTPGFLMELFGHTVNERPLYYQRIFGGPFTDSLVIVREGHANPATQRSR